MNTFTHLHVHSACSPRWGIHGVEELCAAARAMGAQRLALTDRNGLYGMPRFIEAARRHGLAPIVGAEVTTQRHRAVLLVRNEEGYANLCRLLSARHEEAGFDLRRHLIEERRGLFVLTDDAEIIEALHRHAADLFVELSPGHGMERALALARRAGLPPVATSRAVALTAADFELHRTVRAIALNTKLSRLRPEDTAGANDLLLPPQRLRPFFPHCPEAIANAAGIAAACRSDWRDSGPVFPAFEGLDEQEAFALLRRRAEAGARRRYGRIDAAVRARLDKELAIIGEKGFAHYFLVVEEIARQSPRTCGRGSAAASLVAYCLEITHVDPVRHNLFFERFLSPGRVDPPDIDIDFPWDERDAVLDFVFARYGRQRAAMVANHVGFKGRAAVREVAKVHGLPAAEIKELTSRISGYWRAEQTVDAIGRHPLFRGEALDDDWRRVLRLAGRLRGQLRHLSLHCGGLVVVPDAIRRYVPVEKTAKGLPVIQWEKDQAEAAGLVKIDILGNRSLAVIRDALAAVRRNTGVEIDYAAWRPLEDEKTCRLLRTGRTMGCFYIESPATRQLLRKMWGEEPEPVTLQRDLFEHLVMASSIIRPAANAFIREFVARMRGGSWRHLHPRLEGVLDETYGLAVYQEQITQLAMALAGFSVVEGDRLRKILSKKDKAQRLADHRQKFFAGGGRNGIPTATLETIWEQILSFSGYSFCKPHSASYALVSCKAAWLKANYPAEFMAAVIANGGGFYSPLAYLSEVRRLGLGVLPPDINASAYAYTGSGRAIRIGLMQIRGLARRGAEALLDERQKNGKFCSFRDFLDRVELDAADVRRLIRAGCFDGVEGRERRPALVWELLDRYARFDRRGDGLLFAEPAAELPRPEPYDDATVLRQELEALDMLVSRHPLELYRRRIARLRPVPAAELDRWVGRYVSVAGWWVTGKTVATAEGRPMEFVSFEDTTAIFDATFFPRAYARFCRKLSRHRPFLLKGRVEAEFGVATLTVEWVDYLDRGG